MGGVEAAFYLTFNNDTDNFAHIVNIYAKVENVSVPRINEPITVGKYTFEIVKECT